MVRKTFYGSYTNLVEMGKWLFENQDPVPHPTDDPYSMSSDLRVVDVFRRSHPYLVKFWGLSWVLQLGSTDTRISYEP